jgi:hypothetical protein
VIAIPAFMAYLEVFEVPIFTRFIPSGQGFTLAL